MQKCSLLVASCCLFGSQLFGNPVLIATAATATWTPPNSLGFTLTGPSFELMAGAPLTLICCNGPPEFAPGEPIGRIIGNFSPFYLTGDRQPANQSGTFVMDGATSFIVWSSDGRVLFDLSAILPAIPNPTLTFSTALVGTLSGCIPFNPISAAFPCADPRSGTIPDISFDLPGTLSLSFSGPASGGAFDGLYRMVNATFISTPVPETSSIRLMGMGTLLAVAVCLVNWRLRSKAACRARERH